MSLPGFEPGRSGFLRLLDKSKRPDGRTSYKTGALNQAELQAHLKTNWGMYLKDLFSTEFLNPVIVSVSVII